MRALPAGCAKFQRTEKAPYTIARIPAPMARYRALSSVISGPTSYVIEKYKIIRVGGRELYHKGCGEALRDRNSLERDISRQAVPIGRVILTADERQQVAAAGRSDTEAILGDEMAGDLFLAIGDHREGRLADSPSIGLG